MLHQDTHKGRHEVQINHYILTRQSTILCISKETPQKQHQYILNDNIPPLGKLDSTSSEPLSTEKRSIAPDDYTDPGSTASA